MVKKYFFWTIVLLACVVGFFVAEFHSERYPSTDNAYVDANRLSISAQVGGPVSKVLVHDHQKVQAHQLLFEIDPAPFALQVQQAEAALAIAESDFASARDQVALLQARLLEAQAQLELARKKSARIVSLSSTGKVSKELADEAQSQLRITEANVRASLSALDQAQKKLALNNETSAYIEAARANLENAKLRWSYTKVYAPSSGQIHRFDLRPGTVVAPGQPLFALVEDTRWWVNANFKETQLKRIHANQPADIELDMYPGVHFRGKVSDISIGSGTSLSLFPPENASGNWVKVTQRFPVKIVIEHPPQDHPLRVGASCWVQVDTTS